MGWRSHPRRWAALAAIVVAAVIAGVVVARPRRVSAAPRDRVAEAGAIAATWVQAWARDDRKVMTSMADKPGSVDATVGLLHDLGSVRATVGAPAVNGSAATVPFDAAVDIVGFGTWRYRGTVPLVDVDTGKERQWRVAFTPAVLHPDLADGLRLVLTRSWPARGTLRTSDGTALPAGQSTFRALMGTTGPASADQAKALGPQYRAGDTVGTSGMQQAAELDLAGRPTAAVEVRRGDTVVKTEATYPGVPGADVRTTLDLRIQAAAESALGTEGNGAAMVVIRPSTGGVLAIVNRPATGFNRALAGRYPPGSTFKVITTLALLQKGIGADTPVTCPKEIQVNGRTFKNAEDEEFGNIDMRTAFAQSCNTAYVQLAQKLSPDELTAAARLLGFDGDPGLTGAAQSQYPQPAGIVDLASSAIGQGRVLATPLQMAAVAASVDSGAYRKPHVVEPPGGVPSVPLPAGTAGVLQSLMRLVVTQGSGVRANVGGVPVYGKTGTAEFGTDNPPRTNAWFISFRGDLASAVVVEDVGLARDFAAPVAGDFYRIAGSG